MNTKKYAMLLALALTGTAVSCTDESLFPLPYNDRTVGAYLRMYKISTNVFDINDININSGANTAFNVIWEAVDEANGNNLEEIEFYVSMRRGTGLTSEVLIKTVSAAAAGFATVPEPTYSVYRRASINITYSETQIALLGIAAAPPSTWPSGSVGMVFPGTLASADQIIYRWQILLKDGRKFSTMNPQATNASENNNTANITSGQFYSAPSVYTVTVRSLIANSWIGTYNLSQRAIWSPSHSVALHQSSYPTYMNEVLFPNQMVTLSVPSGGLSTEREFTVSYRASNVNMRVNLEQTSPGLAATLITGTLIPNNIVPPGTTASNLGTVFVPLLNSAVDCTPEREIYMVTPATGTFAGSPSLQPGLPQFTYANRGVYRTDLTGTTTGDFFSIAVDDDCDEYGRRGGYCTWCRRVYLTLTKL